jgi:hypothetical protein
MPRQDRSRQPHRIGWARLLKRVFDIDMQHCPNCGGGELKIVAAIVERPVLEKILTHLGLDPQPPPKGRAREGGARLRRLSRAGRHPRRATGCPAKPQPGRRCAPCQRGAAQVRLNP